MSVMVVSSFGCVSLQREELTSVPNVANASPTAEATPDPLELPLGSCNGVYGPSTCPPRALQPFEELVDRKLAH